MSINNPFQGSLFANDFLCESIVESRPVPKLGPFEIDHKSAAPKLSDDAFHMALRCMNRSDCTQHGFRSSFRGLGSGTNQCPP